MVAGKLATVFLGWKENDMANKDTGLYVLTAPGHLSQQRADEIQTYVQKKFPGKDFLILGDGMTLNRVPTSEPWDVNPA